MDAFMEEEEPKMEKQVQAQEVQGPPEVPHWSELAIVEATKIEGTSMLLIGFVHI